VITAKHVAFIVIFSAVYAVMRVIPTFPVIGVEGGYFSISDILAPVYGIILGPYIGGISVLIGTILGMSMKAPIFLGLDFLPALVNTVSLGLLVRKKWLHVIILNATLLVAFILNPLTLNFVNLTIGNTTIAMPFAWLHITAFIVLLSPLGMKAGKWIKNTKPKINTAYRTKNGFITKIPSKAIIGFVTLAFIGTMMQHLTGNILYENIFVYLGYMTPEALTGRWMLVFFLYPWERLALIIFASIIGPSLLYVLKKTQLIRETNKNMLNEDEKTQK
jgi:hypothetical protein